MSPRFRTSRVPCSQGAAKAAALALLVLGALVVAFAGVSLQRARRAAKRSITEVAPGTAEFFRVDPSLVLYEETGRFALGLSEPRAIEVTESGAIWIAGDAEIQEFQGGRLARRIPVGEKPICLECESDRSAYVGFQDRVEVWEIAAGERRARWDGLGPRAYIVSIAVGSSGVYVADAGGRVVIRYDREGKIVGRLGEKNPERNVPGLFIPSPHLDVAIGRDGLIRIANTGRHQIEAYTPDGHLEFSWGKASNSIEGFAGCCNPCAFALLGDGSFVTCEKGIPRVKLYDAQGRFVGVVASPERFAADERALWDLWMAGTGAALDVAVDPAGRILVLDPVGRRVLFFERSKVGPKQG